MRPGFSVVAIRYRGQRRVVLSASDAARILASDDWPCQDGPDFAQAKRIVSAALEGHCTHRAASEAFLEAAKEAGIEFELAAAD